MTSTPGAGPEPEGRTAAQEAARLLGADHEIFQLCPGCCTSDQVRACQDASSDALPLLACTRCHFLFPVLPGQWRQLALDAMHSHQCTGQYTGNWQDLGLAIIKATLEEGFTAADLAARFAGPWPGSHNDDQES